MGVDAPAASQLASPLHLGSDGAAVYYVVVVPRKCLSITIYVVRAFVEKSGRNFLPPIWAAQRSNGMEKRPPEKTPRGRADADEGKKKKKKTLSTDGKSK